MKTRILILLFVTAGGAAIWFGTGWFPSIPTADEPSTSTDSDADDESEFELDPVKQQQIWDDEHATFEIEHRLGKLLKDAFRSQDRRILGSLLKEDFQAAVPNPEGAPQASVAGVTESHWEHTDGPSIPTDAKQFVGYLIGEREQFGTVSSRTLRVLRIEETEPDQWSTELFFVAAGTGADGGLRELTLIQNVRMSFASDEDLDSKPVIEEWSVTSRRARTAEKTGFREITQDVGLDQVPIPDNWELPNKDVLQYRFQYAVEDYDGDGHLDIAVAEKANSYLYRWSPEKKQFEDVTKAAGIRPVHELYGKAIDLAGFIDFDNDGLPDLLLGNRLYRNVDGERFLDVTESSGLVFKLQAMGVHVADYDCDGLLDIYIPYQASSDSKAPKSKLKWVNEDDFGEENRLWKNLGDGKFRDVTIQSNAGGGLRHTLAATWFHYDDDHFPDIYIANDLSTNVLLRNRGDGTFEDASLGSRSSDFATSMGVAAGDTDNDGTTDLYVANMYSKMGRRIIGHVTESDYPRGIFEQIQGSCAGNRLYRRSPGSMEFEEFGEAFAIHDVGWAYAPCMADFDNDGWLDLYSTTGFLSFKRDKPDG